MQDSARGLPGRSGNREEFSMDVPLEGSSGQGDIRGLGFILALLRALAPAAPIQIARLQSSILP